MPTISITSNDGKLNSASAVLEVSATNPEYNQPVLRIKQAGERGGAASIRIEGRKGQVLQPSTQHSWEAESPVCA
jgi:hypothetical protein